MASSNSNTNNGIGFCSALFLLFLALRLTGHIDWAWYWIGMPLIAPAVLAILFIMIATAIHMRREAVERKHVAAMTPEERARYERIKRTLSRWPSRWSKQ